MVAYVVPLESAPSTECEYTKFIHLLLYIVGQQRLEWAFIQLAEIYYLHVKWDTHSDILGQHSDKLGHKDDVKLPNTKLENDIT